MKRRKMILKLRRKRLKDCESFLVSAFCGDSLLSFVWIHLAHSLPILLHVSVHVFHSFPPRATLFTKGFKDTTTAKKEKGKAKGKGKVPEETDFEVPDWKEGDS